MRQKQSPLGPLPLPRLLHPQCQGGGYRAPAPRSGLQLPLGVSRLLFGQPHLQIIFTITAVFSPGSSNWDLVWPLTHTVEKQVGGTERIFVLEFSRGQWAEVTQPLQDGTRRFGWGQAPLGDSVVLLLPLHMGCLLPPIPELLLGTYLAGTTSRS